jgi:hypothetical protein
MPVLRYLPGFFILLLCVIALYKQRHFKLEIFDFIVWQYALIALVLNFYHSGFFGSSRLDKHYLIAIVVVPIICAYFVSVKNTVGRFIATYTSIGLIISTIVLALDFVFEINGTRCRAWAGMYSSVAPSILMVPIVTLLFHDFCHGNLRQQVLPMIAFICVVVSTSVLTGARMAFYSLVIVAFLGIIFNLKKFLTSDPKSVIRSIGALAAGLLISLLLDSIFNCGFVDRMRQTVVSVKHAVGFVVEVAASSKAEQAGAEKTFSGQGEFTAVESSNLASNPVRVDDFLSRGMPPSEAARMALWISSLQAISRAPIFGYGTSNERFVITGPARVDSMYSSHNQFLSWLLWGGVLMFFAGILLLLSPIVFLGQRSHRNTGLLVVIAWSLLFLTDQPLLFPQMLLPFVLTLLIARIQSME